jgi:prophage tail gpP-like protein
VEVGEERVLTGYVDELIPDYDATSHTIVANCRSKTADLVDCSSQDKRFKNRTLKRIAQDLAKPYGIEVVDEAGASDPIREFAVEDGQPLAEALEKAAQTRGARILSDAQGRLVIANAVRRKVATPLELGKNIRKGRGNFSMRDRFRHYIVVGQTQGTDNWFGKQASAPKGEATDPRVRKPRTYVIVSDTPVNPSECRKRAEYESRLRWAQGRGVTYTVGGWRHEQGVWRPGDLVRVIDGYLDLDSRMLVSDVQLIENSDDGRVAELRVSPPEAFEQKPVPEPEAETQGVLGW